MMMMIMDMTNMMRSLDIMMYTHMFGLTLLDLNAIVLVEMQIKKALIMCVFCRSKK